MSNAESNAPVKMAGRELLARRPVRLYLTSSFLSTSGWVMQAVAVGKLVYDITHRELDLGLVGLAEFLPAALLVLVTGSVADRYDRRRVAAIALLCEAAATSSLAVYASGHHHSILPIYGIVLAFGTARAFAAPATRSMPPSIAPPGTLPRLIAFSSATWQSAGIAGPAAAGFLYLVAPWWPFAISAVMVAIAALSIVGVEYVNEQRRSLPPSLHTALEGLRFVRRTPLLLAAIALDLFAVLFGGAVALLPAIASEKLHVDAGGLGLLRAAGGVGAAVMAVYLAAHPVHRRVGRTLLIAVGCFGVATIVLGLTHSFITALVMMALLNAADMVSVFIRGTIVPLATPDPMRGRVVAVENVFIGASNELGAFESGSIGQLIGTTGSVVSGGVATLVVVVLWWVGFPDLRNVDRFEEVEAREDAPALAHDAAP